MVSASSDSGGAGVVDGKAHASRLARGRYATRPIEAKLAKLTQIAAGAFGVGLALWATLIGGYAGYRLSLTNDLHDSLYPRSSLHELLAYAAFGAVVALFVACPPFDATLKR